MNKAKFIELFQDGAYYVIDENRFYHSSFRKGFRSITPGNISLEAAKKHFGSENMTFENGVLKLAS